MGTLKLNESPIRFSKEERTIRAESDILKDKECKVIKIGPFRGKAIICKFGREITMKKI